MDIVISHGAGKPIYEQIVQQVKSNIMKGTLREGDQLPSIRVLANDLGVSVITTKHAYTDLEEQGYICTVQGVGSFVAAGNQSLMREEQLRRIEAALNQALDQAYIAQVPLEELHEMLDVLADGQGV